MACAAVIGTTDSLGLEFVLMQGNVAVVVQYNVKYLI